MRELDRAVTHATRILALREGEQRAEEALARARSLRADAIAARERLAHRRMLFKAGVVGLYVVVIALIFVGITRL